MAGPTLSTPAEAAPTPGRCYRVGGVVRDQLLGQAPGDTDWVVVGATPQAMRDAGFRPVGRDFPVFLHPSTGDEYALARTERKSAPGYRGFVVHADPSVTLEDDLARRDLTINAMALDGAGQLIDPFGGEQDLRDGVLRHVSPAFQEDPVRLLRVARFAARWPHFRLAPETLALLQHMVAAGEVDALVPERVWQELARGLMEAQPSRMLQVLLDCGAAPHILPGLVLDTHRQQTLDHGADDGAPLSVRTACLLVGAVDTGQRWRVPRDILDLAVALQRECSALTAPPQQAVAAMSLLERCDTWRRPARFTELLWAAQCLALARAPWLPRQRWQALLDRVLALDTTQLAQEAVRRGLQGPAVGQFIRTERLVAITAALEPDSA